MRIQNAAKIKIVRVIRWKALNILKPMREHIIVPRHYFHQNMLFMICQISSTYRNNMFNAYQNIIEADDFTIVLHTVPSNHHHHDATLQLCYTVPSPINILLQRQPPAPTASFFQKVLIMTDGDNEAKDHPQVATCSTNLNVSMETGSSGVKMGNYPNFLNEMPN